MTERVIRIKGAHENNLKDIDVEIAQGILCGVCGVSGSGKSTLACDVIAQYSLNNFSYSLPTYLRKKVFTGKRPEVTSITDVPPVILVDIKNANKSSRSTVATISGLMSVLRNIYSQYGEADNDNTKKFPRLFSYNIPEFEGGGACSTCCGTGISDSICVENLLGNTNMGILSGGFNVVSNKGIKYTKISDLFIEAFCKEYNILTECPVKDLSVSELNLIMYGTDKVINFTDRSGANNGKKSIPFPGVVGALIDVYGRTKNDNIAKIVETGKCHSCHGTRYNSTALSYQVAHKSIAEVLNMSIVEANDFALSLSENEYPSIGGLINEFFTIAQELIDISVGYLELSRAIASISGGELQRIKLAKQISMKLSGYCYVIDEPSSGLHYHNITKLVESLIKLKQYRNTVIVVEHNTQILKRCDYLIELGVKGGAEGGNVIACGTPNELSNGNTLTGKMLKAENYHINNREIQSKGYIKMNNIVLNNLKGVNLIVPLNEFVTVAGVSGSGKSSAINSALYCAVEDYLLNNRVKYNLEIVGDISRIVLLQQNASVANSRSTVATLLGIMEPIREFFCKLPESRLKGYDKTHFSLNGGKGSCEICNGAGYVVDNDGDAEEVCPNCDGTGYSGNVLKVKYRGYSISDILSLSINELKGIIENDKIKKVLNACDDVGIGYMSLGRKSTTLSKGEYQRVRIVNEICQITDVPTLFILDEPSKGLHTADVNRLVDSLRKLLEKGHSVIAIEHNIGVILDSDYVLEFGPEAGNNGGNIIFEGTPKELMLTNTFTAQAAKNVELEKDCKKKPASEYTKPDLNIVLDNMPLESKKSLSLCRDRINIIKGGIGSGKSEICRKFLFANPFKKYVSCISTQGKYLTRDIEAWQSSGIQLPLARIVDVTEKFYKKNERVVETLNLNYYITSMYYGYGVARCPKCGNAFEKLSNFSECNKCGEKIDIVVYKGAFDTAKKTCKCSVCAGDGRIQSYDFERIFSSKTLEKQLLDLMKDRTRYGRIQPLLKEKYGVDIGKEFSRMNEEEKKIFLYGDKKKEVLYKPKNKTYTWDGCNNLLNSNLTYAGTDFIDEVKATYINRMCPYCNGNGSLENIEHVTYKNIPYFELLSLPIRKVSELLSGTESICQEEERLLDCLNLMISLHLGEISLNDYVSDMNLGQKSIVQYLTYRLNPLFESVIIWDNFSSGKSYVCVETLVEDLKNVVDDGTMVVLVDNNLFCKNANTIDLSTENKSNEQILENGINEYGCFLIDSDKATDSIDRNAMNLTSKTTIGSICGYATKIRNEFKKKFKSYAFTGVKEDEKCSKCHGKGYYEVNLGDIGFSKCMCPECQGSGLSNEVLKCKIEGKNIADLMNTPISELYDWLTEKGYQSIAKLLDIFIDLGVTNIPISRGISNVSYNEASLLLIGKFICEKEKHMRMTNLFLNVDESEYIRLINVIDKNCRAANKRFEIVKVKEVE